MTAPALRPLSIGEIFDRAVTIYVKNFVLFSLILSTVLVPRAFVRYISQGNTQVASVQQSVRLFENPIASFKHPQRNTIRRSHLQNMAMVAEIGMWLLVEPVATCAVAIGVGMLYAGQRPDFSSCFARALRSWPRMLGTIAAFAFIFLGVYTVGGIALLFLVVTGGFLMATAFPVAAMLFVLSAIAFVILLLFLVAMALAGSFAYFTASIEGSGVASSVAWGMGRIFAKSEYRRTLLMVLAYGALLVGVLAVSTSTNYYVLLALKLPMLENVIVTLVGVVFCGFATTLLSVYYFDVRVRQEGYDLETDLARLGTGIVRATA